VIPAACSGQQGGGEAALDRRKAVEVAVEGGRCGGGAVGLGDRQHQHRPLCRQAVAPRGDPGGAQDERSALAAADGDPRRRRRAGRIRRRPQKVRETVGLARARRG
jgi:hypothetical protein